MIASVNYLTQQQENKWIFYAAGNSWQVWEKPDACSMIHIVVIGAGSGGGGGFQRAAAAGAGGGGGGAAGGIYTMMIPAYTIPDKLHIQVGVGGAGGANLAAGSVATPTYIGLVPDTTNFLANMLIRQTYGGASVGGAGGAAGGSGGSGSGTVIQWFLTFTGWGKTVQTVAGQNGQAGTGAVNLAQTTIIGGGAGGAFAAANTQVVGNSVTSSYKQPSAVVYSVGQQPIGSSTNAGNGPNLISPQPQFFGGASGSALTTATTVNGGAGGIGCGGGGAGVCLTGRTGIGGRGGDGMVIITCW